IAVQDLEGLPDPAHVADAPHGVSRQRDHLAPLPLEERALGRVAQDCSRRRVIAPPPLHDLEESAEERWMLVRSEYQLLPCRARVSHRGPPFKVPLGINYGSVCL